MSRRDTYIEPAEGIPFDNDSNSYTADNTQTAIEEAGRGEHLIYHHHCIHVDKNGNDTTGTGTHHNPYLTIGKAIAHINAAGDAAEDNAYLIKVGPGTFTESALTVPSYVSIRGFSQEVSIIKPATATQNLFTMSQDTELSFLNVQDVGSGYAAVVVADNGGLVSIHSCNFTDCDTSVKFTTSTTPSFLGMAHINITGAFTYGAYILSQNNVLASFNLSDFVITGDDTQASASTGIIASGALAFVLLDSGRIIGAADGYDEGFHIKGNSITSIANLVIIDCEIGIHGDSANISMIATNIYNNILNGAGIYLEGGTSIDLTTTSIIRCDEGIYIANDGESAGNIVGQVNILDCTDDLLALHPSTVGSLIGVLTREKITNNSEITLQLAYQDNAEGDYNITRNLFTHGFGTGLQTITVAAQTTQLNAYDDHAYILEGSVSGQILKLPDATTLRVGIQYWIINDSSEIVTVKRNDDSEPFVLTSGASVRLILKDNSTTAGDWNRFVASSSTFQGTAPVLCSYNGNANTGRYLEFWPGQASLKSPFTIIVDSLLLGVSLRSTASTTVTVDLVNIATSAVIYSISLSASQTNSATNLNIPIPAGTEVGVSVSSGSVNKPHMAYYFSAS